MTEFLFCQVWDAKTYNKRCKILGLNYICNSGNDSERAIKAI